MCSLCQALYCTLRANYMGPSTKERKWVRKPKHMDYITEEMGLQRSDKQRTSGPHRGGPMHPSLMHLVSTVTTLSLLTVKLQNRYDNLTTFQN